VFSPTELSKERVPIDGPAEVPQRAERFSCFRGEQSDRRSCPKFSVLLLPKV